MILAIDLGLRKTGLAISEGSFASPYKTITHKSKKEALKKVIEIIDDLQVDKVIIGYVQGKIKSFFEDFAKQLSSEKADLDVILEDETLTTRQANSQMFKLGIRQKKRSQNEHSMAASLILQNYLDRND